ncbi:TauD/TfdA family dioxygenase [Diaphorobacter sp. HDW4A]|uniref:TauD/TfdA dioxygenase family protein n=1 Tax=Diaphorobacter sp. HDW4A TaxID=2714924 RepID=UPI00140BE3BE|nr:TauD/TfdA family dioxygenase [Diaphorobacter sp. HDW4A]QIL80367.1 TauD/TfdA family dioxygenase [Diaphorobacter sp. HDW4A]
MNAITQQQHLLQADAATATQPAQLTIQPLSGRIGAVVHGVKISGDLPAALFDQIQAALLKHRVLFFRSQTHLDDGSHQAFGKLFGALEAHPTVPAPDGTAFLELNSQHGGRADSWHTDVTFKAAFPKVCVLRAVTLPSHGGDTVWANTVAAYDSLPEPLKQLAEQLWAVHGNDYDYAESFRTNPASNAETEGRASYRKVFTSRTIEAEQPLVHVHPETGEKALLLGHFAKRFKGLRTSESNALLQLFNERITRLENTVRWTWAEGDVAVWDNRATQHYAINDYGDAHRVVRRVTVTGEVATAVDGRQSVDLSETVH